MNITKFINKTMKLLTQLAVDESKEIGNECDAQNTYYCTRPQNHKGYHIALSDEIVLIWKNDKVEK